MEITLKPEKEILLRLLGKMFEEDLKNGKCIPTDQLQYVWKDEERQKELFNKWLVENGYATEVLTRKIVLVHPAPPSYGFFHLLETVCGIKGYAARNIRNMLHISEIELEVLNEATQEDIDNLCKLTQGHEL